jgi:multidrug efflux pump subunit AcrA (membrane-fusion protein)
MSVLKFKQTMPLPRITNPLQGDSMPHGIIRILILTLIFAAAPALAQESHNGKVYSSVMRWSPLTFPGIVRNVLVAPGDMVTAGQTLLTYTLNEQVARELQNELDAGPRTQDLEIRLLEVKRQLQELEEQQQAASRLSDAKLGTGKALTRLQTGRDLLMEQRKLLTEAISKQQGAYLSRLRELESRFGTPLVKGRIPDLLRLTSETNGQVLQMDMWLRPDMAFGPIQNAVAVGILDPVRIRTHVFESEIGGLSVGDTAKVVIASLGDQELEASIVQIDRSPVDLGLDRPSYYAVELQAANPDLSLRQGFKASIVFTAPHAQAGNQ